MHASSECRRLGNFWDVLQQHAGTPQKWYLEVKPPFDGSVPLVVPVNNAANSLTDVNLEAQLW